MIVLAHRHRGRMGSMAITLGIAGAVVGCTHVDVGPRTAAPRRTVQPRTVVRAPRPLPPPVAPVRKSTASTIRAGHSLLGTPIDMFIFGSGPDYVLILGGIHGNEPSSAQLAHDLVDYLRRHPDVANRHTIAILPAVNPDGLARNTRGNARNVDLNRNFPARNWKRTRDNRYGLAPASEPETRAIMAALERVRPHRIISIHSISRGRACNNYDGPAKHLAVTMSRYNGYPPRALIGYPTPGSFGTWAGVEQQIPTVTLELPRGCPRDEAWGRNREALLSFIRGGIPLIAK